MTKVFIDGRAGTTGLRIYERLEARNDIELITLSEAERKEDSARKRALNSSDISFLCLPDDASRQAVSMIDNENTVVIDTSTAHRTAEGWAYGLPELGKDYADAVKSSKRIAVPGCHASGFIVLVHPLIKAGLVSTDALLTCHSMTGYSGGGKKMIADYEADTRNVLLNSPRQYGLTQTHKHLKEMVHVTGIENAPVFCPIVADFYSGMEVTVPLFASQLKGSAEDIKELYRSLYTGAIVNYADIDEGGFASAGALSGKDSMRVSVEGNDDRILLIARYDNLGKGASGAAIECMNLVLGFDAGEGLDI